jgi:phosphotransferase family enzyme
MSALQSAHARYREQLEALAGSEVVLLAAEEAAVRWGWPERRTWRRMNEHFEPESEPYATWVLATEEGPQRIVRLEAFRERRPEPGLGACVIRAGAAGRLRVTRFPSDPTLPTLERALAAHRRWTVVRYRPGRRCTIRVDEEGSVRFAKVYRDGAGERAHADGLQLWGAARRGELGFLVAKPERFDPELRVVWHGSVAGAPVGERLRGPRGEELARRLGRAAGTLERASLRPRLRRDRRTELARSRLRCFELERRVPALGEPARQLLAALDAAHAACEPGEPRPVHGALHVSQWLENGEGVALLDYDSLALGDPELDAATFLADLDVQNRERLPVDRLGAAFLSGFVATAGPLDLRLLATYRAHRRLEKALRVARALRPDGDRKAERRLRLAIESLGGCA